jgi:hypothetical protein
VLNSGRGDIEHINKHKYNSIKAYNITNKYSIMKKILEEQQEKIAILLKEAYEEFDEHGISYYSGQRDLIHDLLSLCIE